MYYHTLANQHQAKKDSGGVLSKDISYDAQRAWFWFPLFSFFESGIGGKIPNEFEWPLTLKDVKDILKQLQDLFLSLSNAHKRKKKTR